VVARYADRVVVMYGGRVVETAPARALYGRPQHPYTRGLLASVPRLDGPAGERLVPIDGSPPDLAALPAGCAFAPRCTQAVDACRSTRPRLRAVSVNEPMHQHACLLDLAGAPGSVRADARSTLGALP
jgi:oligopeptide transport system ATP-binding protein